MAWRDVPLLSPSAMMASLTISVMLAPFSRFAAAGPAGAAPAFFGLSAALLVVFVVVIVVVAAFFGGIVALTVPDDEVGAEERCGEPERATRLVKTLARGMHRTPWAMMSKYSDTHRTTRHERSQQDNPSASVKAGNLARARFFHFDRTIMHELPMIPHETKSTWYAVQRYREPS